MARFGIYPRFKSYELHSGEMITHFSCTTLMLSFDRKHKLSRFLDFFENINQNFFSFFFKNKNFQYFRHFRKKNSTDDFVCKILHRCLWNFLFNSCSWRFLCIYFSGKLFSSIFSSVELWASDNTKIPMKITPTIAKWIHVFFSSKDWSHFYSIWIFRSWYQIKS